MKIYRVLKGLLLLAIATSFVSCGESKPDKEIGLQLWSVRNDMRNDAAATLQKVGEMGYAFIEAAGYGDGKFYGIEPVEFTEICKQNGLEFLASHTGKALPTDEEWDATMAWWDQCIDAHVAAGVKYIVQPFMDERGYGDIQDLKLYAEYFNVVGEKCSEKGIQFGYHNHDGEFEEIAPDTTRYDILLSNTNPEFVFFQPDLYWIVVGGKNPVDYFEKYPGRFWLWHVKDEKELGESGKMDFEAMFAKTEVSGMKHLIVEVEKYNFEPIVSVEKSLQFLLDADYVQ